MKQYYEVGSGIKSWCGEPEEGALEQAENVAKLPFIFKYVALMPDAHQGYGMPIGGVAAFNHVIVPNAVGVDIGCGMLACQTSLEGIDTPTIKKIMGDIRESVPVGFNHRKEPVDSYFMPKSDNGDLLIVGQQWSKAFYQLGTLGGGNHFIEIQQGDDGHIWFMVHSGSRNVGLQVAKHYDKIAQGLNNLWHSTVEKNPELAFLPLSIIEAKEYKAEMEWCLDFALANRDYMAEFIRQSFGKHTGATIEDKINIHHNYASIENHFGKNVVVHRKGASSAKEGQLGIIPGSQGTASYITIGKGNPESFNSSSHGAGRKMGRNQAIRTLSLKEETQRLDEQGILHSIRGQKDLDEASGAYKDIDIVMEEQSDLVEIRTRLTPLAVIKG